MPTGGNLAVRSAGQNTVTNSLAVAEDRLWSATGTLSLTQPILRNLGIDFNRSGIRIARNNLDQAYFAHQQSVQDTVLQVSLAYWVLFQARENLRVQSASLDRIQTILGLTKDKIEAGKSAQIELWDVRVNLANQIEAVHLAQQAYLDAEEELKRLIAPEDVDFIWNAHLDLTTEPALGHPGRPVQEYVRTSLELRPEIHRQQKAIANADEALLQARNQLLPRLDFTGSVAIADDTTSSNFARSVDTSFSGNFGSGFGWNWSAGVVLEIPVGNRPARSTFTQRTIERRQQEATLRNLESTIVGDVRRSFRDVETTYRRVEVTAQGTLAAQQRYEGELTRFRLGESDNFRLLQFRDNLLQAELRWIQARSEHARSHTTLQRSVGTILRRLRASSLLPPVENRP
jgi:outer membrane protein TolC